VRRNVVETVTENLPRDDCYLLSQQDVRIPMHSKTIISRSTTCSEDINSSRRWRELAGRLWCDPNIDIHRVGGRDIVRISTVISFCATTWCQHEMVGCCPLFAGVLRC
jgi:hypothetical protein